MGKLPVDLRIPVILGPMSGSGICTPELVAAVSNAGGLGTFAAQYLKPEVVDAALTRIRELTSRPIALNFFSPNSRLPLSGDVEAQIRLLAPIHEKLGIDAPALPSKIDDYFGDYVELALKHRVPIVSFTMGTIPEEAMRRLRAASVFLMATATTVSEATEVAEAGFDAVIAQGAEAGGHRGSFVAERPGLVGTMALVPQVADAVNIPVIASGGIMDGRGIVAALALGAAAVQMGTAFLTCEESGAPRFYKEAILAARDEDTAMTRAFSGRWARGIRNEFMELTDRAGSVPISFPWQNSLTGPMRATAIKKGEAGYLSLWAGQGGPMAKTTTAQELMQRLEGEIERVSQRLGIERGGS